MTDGEIEAFEEAEEEREPLRDRTRRFSVVLLRECYWLPNVPECQVIRNQLSRSGTAPGAHWREAERARSQAEFIAKVDLGLQELSETLYWLEILGNLLPKRRRPLAGLYCEAKELMAIFTSISKGAKEERDNSAEAS